jgi:hypothetical protein
VEVVRPVVHYKKDYTSMPEGEVFPKQRAFHSHAEDRVEQSVVVWLIGRLVTYLPMAGRAQTGMIHHYLIYPVVFMILIMLLTHFNYI